jgi:sulfopyruvate decarboxylase TPP-binding subunit
MLEGLFHAKIDWLVIVPSNGLNAVYSMFERKERCIFATREEEAVAIASGLSVAGCKPLVVMQQTGVGNSLNVIFTLADAYDLYFPILVCDRTQQDPNPVQRVSSRETEKLLHSMKARTIDWLTPNSSSQFVELVEQRTRWIVCEIRGT